MFGRFAKRVGETALEGAAKGFGAGLSEELKPLAHAVGEGFETLEEKVDEVHDMVRVLYEKFGLDPESGPEPRKRDEID